MYAQDKNPKLLKDGHFAPVSRLSVTADFKSTQTAPATRPSQLFPQNTHHGPASQTTSDGPTEAGQAKQPALPDLDQHFGFLGSQCLQEAARESTAYLPNTLIKWRVNKMKRWD